MKLIQKLFPLMAFILAMSVSLNTTAAVEEPPLPDTFATHKIVLQISDADTFKQELIMNVAGNLQKHYGASNVDIEIVAFGQGVRLMLEGNSHAKRIKSFMDAGVRFSACDNTLGQFTKMLGYRPNVLPGVTVVPAGAARILQLNAAGYQILKP